MKRDLDALARDEHDVLVVGGGIYGVCLAREAALRGLRTALVERDDFGHATSWNSMKIVHGGLRYLQSLDVVRTRESIREQATWLGIAPGLVRPRAFVMPTYAGSRRGRAAMRLGLAVNELLRLGSGGLGSGRILGRAECLELVPHVATEGLTGAALWTEAVIESSERLLVAVLRAAVGVGATVANHVEATGLLAGGRSATGVRARDVLGSGSFEVRARTVIDARGPGCERPLGEAAASRPTLRWARAMNLVTRPLNPGCAVGVSSRRGEGRLWFVVPWRDASLVGTAYFPADDGAGTVTVRDEEIASVVREVAAALPGASLRREDVRLVQGGLVPVRGWGADGEAKLASRPTIEERDGMLRVVGVKYTTARRVAEVVVDRLVARDGRPPRPSTSATTPLPDAGEPELPERTGLSDALCRRLAAEYGAAASRVVAIASEDREAREPLAPGGDVVGAEVLHAVRHEMALTLADVVFRRTSLGSAGDPGETALSRAASLVARELGWGTDRTARELEAVRDFLGLHHARVAGAEERRAATP